MTQEDGEQDAVADVADVADVDRVMEVKTNGNLVTYPCDG
jgi:hypothetical protein